MNTYVFRECKRILHLTLAKYLGRDSTAGSVLSVCVCDTHCIFFSEPTSVQAVPLMHVSSVRQPVLPASFFEKRQ